MVEIPPENEQCEKLVFSGMFQGMTKWTPVMTVETDQQIKMMTHLMARTARS